MQRPLLGSLFTLLVLGLLPTLPACAQTPPATFKGTLLDASAVTAIRDAVLAGEATEPQQQAVDTVIENAEKALELPVGTVINKPQAPASGTLNDYVSLSPYWWPNPDTDDGLPYVRRDGEFNPQRDAYDVSKLSDLSFAVKWLGTAYYFTGDERYAKDAIERCKVWFIDEDTRMTPRMQFAQFIPGVADDGRHFGIIETVRLRWFPDTFAMLEGSPHMTPEIRQGVRQWFADYATWLSSSEFGVAELTFPNNHGTWANAQMATYAFFGGDHALAKQALETIPDRIANQIEPDGLQPHEAKRTTSLHYHDFNLRAMLDLALIGEKVGVDLWSFETQDGRSIRKAAEFLVPYLQGDAEWPYEQIRDPKAFMHAQAMRKASLGFDDPTFDQTIPNLMTWPGMTAEGLVWTELLLPHAPVATTAP